MKRLFWINNQDFERHPNPQLHVIINKMTLLSPESNSLILVAVMNQPKDLEIARLLGWYRIPLRSAPKVIAVDYLAFYQTAVFGDQERWRVRHLAPVLGHELTTRIDLLHDEPDHPHAHREYYKIQIGPLIRLENPIVAGTWHRITFLYTTGELFNQAKTIQDLIVPSDQRQVLWQALRERGSQAQSYCAEQMPEIDLDPEILAAILGLNKMKGSSDDNSH